jgi:ubiquinone/menaquinone biosynthesis C-methylase UbiE
MKTLFKKKIINSVDIGRKNDSDRINWTRDYLLRLPSGLRILDAGAGECQFKKYCGHLDYTSQDFTQYNGEGNNKGLQEGEWDYSNIDIVSDINSIPCPDKSYDVVLCTEVFEHIPDPISAIKEFSRLLKNGGELIITAPFTSVTHFAPYHYYSGFNKYFYESNLTSLGFENIEIRENGSYFEYLSQEIWRLPLVSKMYTRKKVPLTTYICMYILLRFLKRISSLDQNSNELICFGFFVTAVKK